jgi:hypothetical protein
MLNEAARLLDTTMREWQQEGAALRVEQFFDIAVLCGSVEATPLDEDSLAFLLTGTEKHIYEGMAYQFRSALAQLCLVVDEIRFPELSEPMEFTEEEVAQEATRLGIPIYLPEDEKEDFHARLVREETGRKMPPRRLEQVYVNLSEVRRREREQRGVQRVNKYGFEVSIDYPYGAMAVIPLHIKVANDRMNPPFYFCIRRTADN